MVFSPLVQSAQAFAFSERQAARAKAQDERQQESEMLRALKSLEGSSARIPDGALATIQNDNRADSDRDGLSDVEERLFTPTWWTPFHLRRPALCRRLARERRRRRRRRRPDRLHGSAKASTLPDSHDSDGDTITGYAGRQASPTTAGMAGDRCRSIRIVMALATSSNGSRRAQRRCFDDTDNDGVS
jgi:hypothetical protein